MSNGITGPHQAIRAADDRERFLAELFDRLWDRYRARVSFVQTYERLVKSHRATFVNDHIAFRTFACQQPLTGVASLSRIFEALGYRAAGVYHFEDKHLGAIHFQHANAQLPKLFISELRTWELGQAAQLIAGHVAGHRPAISIDTLADLSRCGELPAARRTALLTEVSNYIQQRPWPAPRQQDVAQLNKASQYAAWVLVHGYEVNHFTSLVNSHGVEPLNDLEKTITALRGAGVPMKAEIEGEPGSKLRQSATDAVTIDVEVMDDAGHLSKFPWTYAYFEFAERNLVRDPVTGQLARFEGFLGPQATNLFEMTRVKPSQG
jgi:hypothetical protein